MINKNLKVNFKEFPHKEGVVFSFEAGSYVTISGELKNKPSNIKDASGEAELGNFLVNYLIWFLNLLFISIAYLSKIRLWAIILLTIPFANLEIYNFNQVLNSKPTPLKKIFNGEKYNA